MGLQFIVRLICLIGYEKVKYDGFFLWHKYYFGAPLCPVFVFYLLYLLHDSIVPVCKLASVWCLVACSITFYYQYFVQLFFVW